MPAKAKATGKGRKPGTILRELREFEPLCTYGCALSLGWGEHYDECDKGRFRALLRELKGALKR